MNSARIPAVSKRRPFPGLRPFEFEDHEFFFGREEQTFGLYRLIDRSRFVAVIGSSGSGKSSLVRAGVLPLIYKETKGSGGRTWDWVTMRPGDAPLRRLADTLVRLPKGDDEVIARARWERVAYHLRRSSYGISHALAEIENLEHCSLLLVVDQFEELFRYAAAKTRDRREQARSLDEATHFVQLLLEATRSTQDVRILITMRSDFIGECSRFEALPEAVSGCQLLVPGLTRDQREEVIRNPIEKAGAKIEPALVQRLLNDSSNDLDQLPVLQHCLQRIWEQACKEAFGRDVPFDAVSPLLTEPQYAEIGGMRDALSLHADEILRESGRPEVVEKVFRALAEIDKEGRAIRRMLKFRTLCAETGEPAEAVRKVVDRFREDDCSFLTPSKSTVSFLEEETPIDVGHEALLRRWKRVAGNPEAVTHDPAEQEPAGLRRYRALFAAAYPRRISAGAASLGSSSAGWGRLEERDGEIYRSLLSWAKTERGALPVRTARARQRWWNTRRPTLAWADRYGGGFDRVERLVRVSLIKRRLIIAAGALGTAAALVLVAYLGLLMQSKKVQQALLDQQTAFARSNFELAVTSAKNMLTQVKKSFDRGTITVRGANEMLQVAKSIVDQVHTVENTPATIALLVSYYHSNSDIQADLGQYDKAQENAEIAKDKYVEPLLREYPDDPEVLLLLYGSIWRIADAVDARGGGQARRREALRGYLEAEKVAQRLAEPTRHRELMFIHHKIGDMYQDLGELDRALAEYRAAQAFIDALVASEPNRRDWRRDAAIAKRRIAQALEGLGDFQGALGEFSTALAALTVLADEQPNDTVVWVNLATNHREIAQVYALQGNVAGAAAEFEAGIAIVERLLQMDRDNATRHNSLAAFHSGLAAILVRQGDLAGAIKRYRMAYDLRDELATKDPTSEGRQISRAKAGIALADVLPGTNENAAERLELYKNALKVLDEPRYKPRYERDVFHCYEAIGNIRLAANNLDNAFTEYNRAWTIARESAAANPASVVWQRSLVTARVKIGDVLARQERLGEALEHYQQALVILADLTARYPKSTEWPTLAESVKVKADAIRTKP
jgi:tetratricopeptide (TPR) repeat protein